MKNLLVILSVFISGICLFNECALTSQSPSQETPPLHPYCIYLKVKDEKGRYFTSKELREKTIIKIREIDPRPYENIRFEGVGGRNYEFSNSEMSSNKNGNIGFVSLYALSERISSGPMRFNNLQNYLKKREISIQIDNKTMNLVFKNIQHRTYFRCKAYSIESPIFDEGKYEIDLQKNSVNDRVKWIEEISSDKWIKLVTISKQ
jgi:hypothetical protein